MPVLTPRRPVCLVILDGVGYRTDPRGNAVAAAATPFLDRCYAEFPWVLLEPGGEAVGLPPGQMGNSEVGHLNLGAGRVVYQELTRINRALQAGELRTHPVLLELLSATTATEGDLHLLGLCSDGGVHSSLEHLLELVRLLPELFAGNIWLHLLTDGRDTSPASGLGFVEEVEAAIVDQPRVRIADVGGRYYTMDRDQRWERIERGYRVLVDGASTLTAPSASAAIQQSYAAGTSDEFIHPTRIDWPARAPLEGCIQPGDGVLCFNFRADRMRQIVRALIDPTFPHFPRPHWTSEAGTSGPPSFGFAKEGAGGSSPAWAGGSSGAGGSSEAGGSLHLITLTQYDASFPVPALFPPQDVREGLTEYLTSGGLRVFKIAETEKYAHVTYFFNGGVEAPFPGEERRLIPSPKIATYDLQPAMSAPEVTAALVERIRTGSDSLIVCNYANGDMVGHTGNFPATVAAMEVLDQALATVFAACQERGMVLCITADHGNAEEMWVADASAEPLTQHSLEPVPFIVCDPSIALAPGNSCSLAHVAPTVLQLMGLPIPPAMTAPGLCQSDSG